MELITITGNNEMTEKQEPKIDGPGLFPQIEPGTREAELFSSERCVMFDKPTIFFSARVHPGEV